jgi:hypothetical protein
VALLRASQKMKKEMDRAWEDFFEKNPDKKEEGVWRRVEGNLFPFLGKEIEALV